MTEKLSDTERAHYERMKDTIGSWSEFLHPKYGPCDALAEGGMCTECVATVQDYRALEQENAGLRQQVERLEDALTQIVEWSKAYPLDVFPEPDFKKAAEVLKANGMTLDAISASNMRHVVEGVGSIAKAALASKEEEA